MIEEPFDPADASCWLARGRTPAHAAAIASAWRDFPDLPPNAPAAERLARGRERIAALDEVASALPLCRTMERTRNTRLQQRTHLRVWLDRGYGSDGNMAAGHIRWSKAIHGLHGKLGEFTARHVGAAPSRGHLIRVETISGALASGYAASDGTPLAPEFVVSSKAKIRASIATALRSFAASTPLMGTLARRAA